MAVLIVTKVTLVLEMSVLTCFRTNIIKLENFGEESVLR